MSMEDARLDHMMLRLEEIERVLGCGDYEPRPDERTLLTRLDAIETRLQMGPLRPGETRYGGGGNSVHMHMASGPCTCGETIRP